MNKRLSIILLIAVVLILLCSCGGGSTTAAFSGGDTVKLKYAERLTIVKYGSYTVATLADPWNKGRTLHTYILIPDTAKGNADADGRSLAATLKKQTGAAVTVVRTPLKRTVVASSVYCGLLISLGKGDAIRGVCDLKYINQPWVKEQCRRGRIADCGNASTPTLEKIIDINADAILISPFQNSGGYGRLDEWNNPIIETADYMETSALGRAEWMKFYGMLFGVEDKANSMFNDVERKYDELVRLARTSAVRKSVIVDKMAGSVWYVPGGQSTLGRMIADADADYPFSSDGNSGSLQLTFETVLTKAGNTDTWLLRYDGKKPLTYAALLAENGGYAQFKAFNDRQVYGCNTATSTFYEDTPFHPERLLRDFIIITHPDLKGLGEPEYFKKVVK